jgi:LuxR family transcriptional regulator, quorum-sensing system regulator LasR
MDGLENFASLFEAEGEHQWCRALFDLSKRFGFEHTMFAVVPRPGIGLERAYLRSTYAAQWREAYDEQGMVHVDPTVAHCLTRTTPLLWSAETFVGGPQERIYEQANSFGLRTGFALPMRGPHGQAGILCFVTDRALTKSLQRDMTYHLPNISLVRDIALETSLPHLASYVPTSLPRLTARELECLEWTVAGKTSWEISQIFRCSESVVNFHMSNIRQKLGVSSRRAAAVMAVRLGLVSID